MMTVATYIKESPGKGVGIFAAVNIKKGEIVWKNDERFVRKFTQKQLDELDKVQKEFVEKYAYTSHGTENIWELEIDNGRLMNHDSHPNTEYDNETGWAVRDIQKGEELTCDYRSFDTQPLHFV